MGEGGAAEVMTMRSQYILSLSLHLNEINYSHVVGFAALGMKASCTTGVGVGLLIYGMGCGYL